MWEKKDLISINELSRDDLFKIFHLAKRLEGKTFDILKEKILVTAFFEPSTRTRLSFQTAMLKLGGKVIFFKKKLSSMEKGESEEDTILILDQYADIIVIRHPKEGSVQKFAEIAKNPVINAGDGKREHPTQTILDLYTIWKEFERIDNLKIAICGDLKYGRTVHSLILGLKKFSNIKIYGIPVGELKMPDEFKFEGYYEIPYEENIGKIFEEIKPDVVYVTRVQKERMQEGEYVKYKITEEDISILADHAILLHPLPRVDELPVKSFGKHQRMFEQAQNGVWTRMAIILMLFNKENQIL